MKNKSNCDFCMNYMYNEEFGYYECEAKLDEDEMRRFLTYSFDDCPYFRFNDEYQTVRKQK